MKRQQYILRIFCILLALVFITGLKAQKPVQYEQQTWVGYNINYKLHPRWGAWLDGEVHTKDHFFNEYSQFTLRFAGTYFLKNKNRFTAGYGFTDFFPGDNHKQIAIPEHFLWQQFQFFMNTSKHKLMNWVRVEEKWKADVLNDSTTTGSFTNYYKLRYNVFYQLPLSRDGFAAKTLSLALGDEVYLYYGPTLSNHVFDQNRLFLGFSYAVNKHDNLVFGYLNIMQQNQAGTQYKNSSIFKATMFMNFGF
ncbi:MAG: hypothetical protein CFE25_05440 [Chitinophagaceae bacterium BSSC1]|nr:MAG: hypothetical protein CFE25_05440 [Chitinophagaceae bacterium BSSC1]